MSAAGPGVGFKVSVFDFVLYCYDYCSADNTWEPEDNLDCPELIEEFLRNAHFPQGMEEEHELVPKEEMTEQETEIVSVGRKRRWNVCLFLNCSSCYKQDFLDPRIHFNHPCLVFKRGRTL